MLCNQTLFTSGIDATMLAEREQHDTTYLISTYSNPLYSILDAL